MPICEKCGTYIEYKHNMNRHQRTKKCKALCEIGKYEDKGWRRIKWEATNILDKYDKRYEYGYIHYNSSIFGNAEKGYWCSKNTYIFLMKFMIPGTNDYWPKHKKMWEDDKYIVIERGGNTSCYYKENFENKRKRKFKTGNHDTVLYDLDGNRMGHLVPSNHIPDYVVNVMVAEEL